MTLRIRFILWCVVLAAGVLALGGFAASSLNAVGRTAEAAAAEHDA
ncbi:MAG: hypothetical protein JWO31_545, partial [Phycisphaerales bacterium]|nr:hypothetical protein [Phycisphaerales bacterium]